MPRVHPTCAYMWDGQFLSRSRICEAVRDQFGVAACPGSVAALVNRIVGSLSGCLDAMGRALATPDVMRADETGLRVNGKRAWACFASWREVRADRHLPASATVRR